MKAAGCYETGSPDVFCCEDVPDPTVAAGDRAFPISVAAAAHAYIESRQSFGRVLLVP